MAYLRANPVLILLLAYLLLAAALHFLKLADIFPPCMVSRLIGRPCPGCGLTRAGLALARLDLSAAWAFNPAIFFLLPGAVLFMIAHIRSFYQRR